MGFIILAIILAGVTIFYVINTMQEMKMKQGEKAVEEGNMDAALSIFMDSLRRDPENVEALWHLGNINEERGKSLEAIGYYNHLIQIGKESKYFTMFELYRRIGKLYYSIGKVKEALEYYLQAHALLPNSKEVLKAIGMIILSQKKFFRSLPYFEKAAPAMEKDNEFLQNYGLNLLMVDNINDSINVFENIERLFPENLEAKFIMAHIYIKMKAYQRARECIEEVANSEKIVLSKEQMFYAVKILFLSYLEDKNYEVARELHRKMENMTLDQQSDNIRWRDDINMSFIYLRYKQTYYDLALEKLNTILESPVSTEGMSEEMQVKIKENSSFLFEKLSIMNEYKQEHEKIADKPGPYNQPDVNYTILEANAKEARIELNKMFIDWRGRLMDSQYIWSFFKPKSAQSFDPIPIIDKYSEDNVKAIKDKFKKIAPKESKKSTFKTLGVDLNDVCGSMLSADFPSYQLIGKELANSMGFKVINQAIKVDAVAFSEGRGVDILCEEKFNPDVRVLFCMRRWNQPIGFITIQNLLGALREQRSQRLVIVSNSPLSDEAFSVVEKDPKIDFFNCDQVAAYMF